MQHYAMLVPIPSAFAAGGSITTKDLPALANGDGNTPFYFARDFL